MSMKVAVAVENRHASMEPGGERDWMSWDGSRQIPVIDEKDVIRSPLKVEDGVSVIVVRTKALDEAAVSQHPIEDVVVEDLYGWQKVILGKSLKLFRGGYDASVTEPILAVRWKGNVIVLDGNHRASAAWVCRVPTIKAHVLNLDEPANAMAYLRKS